ncbi:hypothetical protein L3476_14610 [Paenibacillus thiaminolyticus]|uniref:hypothetical protein n=1 Tax=Paenibacillus thiaminolyticus TaxID=49283 RepID=UPI0013F68ED3|nr:hypothetical protein [Paenibacillus thiaminolyticus]NGP61829.1 hypothetical protein [Paenibacillus thiaminolyticus]WCR29848.1 hypothetical protein L3476_14610 [Paenibacillus thiaminolyticus]
MTEGGSIAYNEDMSAAVETGGHYISKERARYIADEQLIRTEANHFDDIDFKMYVQRG